MDLGALELVQNLSSAGINPAEGSPVQNLLPDKSGNIKLALMPHRGSLRLMLPDYKVFFEKSADARSVA